jgi:lauroyl/myristoyl acyltransferase
LVVPVETRLLSDSKILFRYRQAFAAESAAAIAARLAVLLEQGIPAAPDQFNWSYPKILVGGA